MGGPRRKADVEPSAIVIDGHAQVEKLTVIGAAETVRLELPELASPSVPAQLPADIADFVGRQAELDELRKLVGGVSSRGSALVISAIAGQPGVGKSTLVRRLAHKLAPHFPDGQLYLDMRGDGSGGELAAGDVLGSFLRALGVRESDIPGRVVDRAALYRTRLAGKRVLVVLDNARDEEQVRPLLPGGPGNLVLVTSRRALAIEGVKSLLLDTFSAEEAVELLGQITGKQRVVAEPEHAVEVARLCGHLPLAVRVVGARLAMKKWTLAQLAERLADERSRLGQLQYGDLSVGASFALSYSELASDEARLFRRLGILVSAEFHSALASFLLDGDASAEETRQLLDALVEAMLLEETAPNSYRIHDLIRLFARERLREEEGTTGGEQAEQAMLGWYAGKLKTVVELLSPKPEADEATRIEMAGWLDAEWPTLIATIETATRSGLSDYITLVAYTLEPFFRFRGAWAGMERLFGTLKTYLELDDEPKMLASALLQIASAQFLQGNLDKAVATCRQALAAARSSGDWEREISANHLLMLVYHDLDDEDSRRTAVEAAATLAEQGDVPCAEARTRLLDVGRGLALEANIEADLDWLYGELDAVLAQAQSRDCHDVAAEAMIYMGIARYHQNKRREAVSLWQKALRVAIDHNVRPMEAEARKNIGTYYFENEDNRRAREHFERALPLFLRLGFHEYAVSVSVHLAELARRRRDWKQMAAHNKGAAGLFSVLRDETGEGNMRLRYAMALVRLGDLDEADHQLGMALKIFKRLEVPRHEEEEEAREALAFIRACRDQVRPDQRQKGNRKRGENHAAR